MKDKVKLLMLDKKCGDLSKSDLESANYVNDYINDNVNKKLTLKKLNKRKQELQKSLDLIEDCINLVALGKSKAPSPYEIYFDKK